MLTSTPVLFFLFRANQISLFSFFLALTTIIIFLIPVTFSSNIFICICLSLHSLFFIAFVMALFYTPPHVIISPPAHQLPSITLCRSEHPIAVVPPRAWRTSSLFHNMVDTYNMLLKIILFIASHLLHQKPDYFASSIRMRHSCLNFPILQCNQYRFLLRNWIMFVLSNLRLINYCIVHCMRFNPKQMDVKSLVWSSPRQRPHSRFSPTVQLGCLNLTLIP